MRLIDADNLKKDFNLNFGGVSHAAAAAEIIDRQPAIAAPTREQVEAWKGEWIIKHDGYNEITIVECSECENETVYEFFFEEAYTNFCSCCGAPMTDEAVDIIMQRLEALKDG